MANKSSKKRLQRKQRDKRRKLREREEMAKEKEGQARLREREQLRVLPTPQQLVLQANRGGVHYVSASEKIKAARLSKQSGIERAKSYYRDLSKSFYFSI